MKYTLEKIISYFEKGDPPTLEDLRREICEFLEDGGWEEINYFLPYENSVAYEKDASIDRELRDIAHICNDLAYSLDNCSLRFEMSDLSEQYGGTLPKLYDNIYTIMAIDGLNREPLFQLIDGCGSHTVTLKIYFPWLLKAIQNYRKKWERTIKRPIIKVMSYFNNDTQLTIKELRKEIRRSLEDNGWRPDKWFGNDQKCIVYNKFAQLADVIKAIKPLLHRSIPSLHGREVVDGYPPPLPDIFDNIYTLQAIHWGGHDVLFQLTQNSGEVVQLKLYLPRLLKSIQRYREERKKHEQI